MKIKVIDNETFHKEHIKVLESSNVNFLIGSGVSANILATLNDVEDLVEYNDDRLLHKTSNSKRTQIEAILYYRFLMKSIYPIVNEDEDKVNKHTCQIAELLASLHSIFEKKKDPNLEKQINIFTTNYDMFFENALEQKQLYYNDGFMGRIKPRFSMSNFSIAINNISNLNFRKVPSTFFNVIKFHGSLNWINKNNNIDYKFDIETKLKQFVEKYSPLFQTTYDKLEVLYKSEKFSKLKLDEKYEKIKDLFTDSKQTESLEFIKEYKKTFAIVNPTKEKFSETLLSLNYHDMLRLYSTNLEREHVSLFVFGFSFADEHILKITERSLINPELKLVIYAYDKNALDSYKEKFSKIKSSNSVTIIYDEKKKMDLVEFTKVYKDIYSDLFAEYEEGNK